MLKVLLHTKHIVMEVMEEGFFFVPQHYDLPRQTTLVSAFRLFVNCDTSNQCMIDNQLLVDQPVCPFYFWTAAMIPPELWRKYKTGWLKILNKMMESNNLIKLRRSIEKQQGAIANNLIINFF